MASFSLARHADNLCCVISESVAALERPARDVSALLIDRLRSGGKILVFGNGGSAAQAAHFAADLVGRFKEERRALPALALGLDGPSATCTGNDFGFEALFERPIAAFATENDVCVGLTTSGRSINVLRGLAAAKRTGAATIALTGSGGLGDIEIDHLLAVPSASTARVQEIHLLLIHAWCAHIDEALSAS